MEEIINTEENRIAEDFTIKNFIIYNQSGQILRTGTCPANMMNIQHGPDEFILEGIADDSKYYIKNGIITEHPEEVIAAKKSQDLQREQINIQQGLINAKIAEILRNQAIEELTKEGKL
jgi:hypothetical protein